MANRHYQAVIVGSGFGGSVLAYNLARAKLSVLVLERGKDYPPNSFPRSPWAMRKNFWDPSNQLFGLYNVWSFKGSAAVVSSGLGGGSLIYANVLIRKDAAWFDGWPITREDLDPHYSRVEQMMNVQPYPSETAPFHYTPKSRELQAAAARVGYPAIALNLAVSFRQKPMITPGDPGPGNPAVVGEPIFETHRNLHGRTRSTCRLCGECDMGCNYGSKNTLDFNYLTEAQREGAEICTLCEVKSFKPRAGLAGYEVTYVRHAGEQDAKVEPETINISCDRLILAAGTFGTTYLLLANRKAFPRLSKALGSKYSTNGDDLAFITRAKRPLLPDYGPVITTAIRYPDTLDGKGDVGRGFYVEDGGNPYLLSWLVELSGVSSLARRAIRFAWIRIKFLLGFSRTTSMGYALSKLIGPTDRSGRAMPVLVMGRDVPTGRLTLKRGVLDCSWSVKGSRDYYDRVAKELKSLAQAMGATYEENPDYRWNFQQVLTAHPLGGCPMGKTEAEGVVDTWGRVFGYPGMYVADGSAMPGPVGPNPSLTIAAFADRVANGIIKELPHQP